MKSSAMKAGSESTARAFEKAGRLPNMLRGILQSAATRLQNVSSASMAPWRLPLMKPSAKTTAFMAPALVAPTPESALDNYIAVEETRRPLFERENYTTQNGRYADEEATFLPLSSDGVAVDIILMIARVRDNYLS